MVLKIATNLPASRPYPAATSKSTAAVAAKTCAERNVIAAAVIGVRRVTIAVRARSKWCGRDRFRTSQRAARSRESPRRRRDKKSGRSRTGTRAQTEKSSAAKVYENRPKSNDNRGYGVTIGTIPIIAWITAAHYIYMGEYYNAYIIKCVLLLSRRTINYSRMTKRGTHDVVARARTSHYYKLPVGGHVARHYLLVDYVCPVCRLWNEPAVALSPVCARTHALTRHGTELHARTAADVRNDRRTDGPTTTLDVFGRRRDDVSVWSFIIISSLPTCLT